MFLENVKIELIKNVKWTENFKINQSSLKKANQTETNSWSWEDYDVFFKDDEDKS